MYYAYENFAYDGTKQRRKQDRMAVRHALGTSSDDAPNVYQALTAARSLDMLLDLASAGALRLRVQRQNGELSTPIEAMALVRGWKEARETEANAR